MIRTTIISLFGIVALTTGALASNNDGVGDDGQGEALRGLTQYAQASQASSSGKSNSKKPSNPPKERPGTKPQPPKERPGTKPQPPIKPPGIYWCKDTKKIVKKGKNDKDQREHCKPEKPKTPY